MGLGHPFPGEGDALISGDCDCWVHAMRNAVEKTPARLREAFKPMAQRVMYATNENAAKEAFLSLKQAFNGDASRAIRCLEKDLESLLVHYRFEQSCWVALKTTNAIERINKEFKRRTKSMETVGESTLEAVVAFAALRLEMGWRAKPINSLSLGNLKNLKNTREVNVIENVIEEIGLLTQRAILRAVNGFLKLCEAADGARIVICLDPAPAAVLLLQGDESFREAIGMAPLGDGYVIT